VNVEGNGALYARFAKPFGEVKGRFAEAYKSQPIYP